MADETQDIPREGGLIRQIRFGDGDFAVFDASSESITANWTTRIAATGFVQVAENIKSLMDADVTVDLSEGELRPMNVDALLEYVRRQPEFFDERCQFLRLDVSETRTLAWQLVMPNHTAVVGFGDSTSKIATTDSRDSISEYFLPATASPNVDISVVLDSLRGLAGEFYRKPFEEGVH